MSSGNLQKPIGYHVYRSTDPDLPKDQWTRVTDKPIPDTHFHDKGLEIGTTYYYYVTTIYPGGNESDPSEVIILKTDDELDWPDTIRE